jgi:hypothetical protein
MPLAVNSSVEMISNSSQGIVITFLQNV